MGFSRGVGHKIFLIFNLGNEKSMRNIIFIIYFFYIKDFFAFFWRFLWQIYRQIVLLPLWINCLHGWFLKPVFFDCNFAISWGQPERLPSETIPIRRIFSAVICLWAPVCDLICIILMAWMYFLQVFAISREIVADAKATKRTKTMHEIFIFVLFCLLIWWNWMSAVDGKFVFSTVYIFELNSLATPNGILNKKFLEALVIFTNEKMLC